MINAAVVQEYVDGVVSRLVSHVAHKKMRSDIAQVRNTRGPF
jgi:hypothetical protein